MILGLICCFIPFIVLLVIYLFAFKFSVKGMLFAILFGLIAILPISVIQYFAPSLSILINNPLIILFFQSFIVYGLIEESFKCGGIICLSVKNLSVLEFLMVSFVFGLTVGCFESAVYFLDHLQKANAQGASLLFAKIFARIFTSDIMHMCCAGLSGIFVYKIKTNKKQNSAWEFIMAVLLHGCYDFFAGFHNNFYYFSIAVVLFAILQCRLRYTAYLDFESTLNK